MKNGRFVRRRGVSTKTMALVLAIVMLLGITIGGTVAWLMDQTPTVTNTFAIGNVTITLTESPLIEGEYGKPAEGVQNTYKLIPGETYKKDPTVTVVGGSEKCYLFVKFEEKGNASTYITYESLLAPDEWTNLEDDVWYRVVDASADDQSWELLKDNAITINAEAVTKNTMEAASEAALVYTAYAVQYDNVDDAAAAWELVTSE